MSDEEIVKIILDLGDVPTEDNIKKYRKRLENGTLKIEDKITEEDINQIIEEKNTTIRSFFDGMTFGFFTSSFFQYSGRYGNGLDMRESLMQNGRGLEAYDTLKYGRKKVPFILGIITTIVIVALIILGIIIVHKHK